MASLVWQGQRAVEATLWSSSGVGIDGWQEVMQQPLGACSGALAAWSSGLPIRSRRGRRTWSLVLAGALDGRSGTNEHGCEMTVLPLVGRERELGVLAGLVDGVGDRGGALVV